MLRPKFDARVEFSEAGSYKASEGLYGNALFELPKFNTSITPKENAFMVLREKKKPFWLPNLYQDFNIIQPMVMPDATARVHGGLDWFGVEWIPQPELGAAMVDHTKGRKLDDITVWEDKIDWPDLNSPDWEGNSQLLKTTYERNRLTYSVVVNGMFERLISLLSFEEALVSLVLEKDAVKRFFSRLTDWYIELFEILKRYYQIDLICFHADWGSQRAPLFSCECLKECILPYIFRLADAAHQIGLIFNLHSCGKVETFVPYMIEAGVDAWEGQDINDKKALREQFKNQIVFIDVFRMDPDTEDERLINAIHEYVDTIAYDGGSILKINDPDRDKTIMQIKELYRYSRMAYSGK